MPFDDIHGILLFLLENIIMHVKKIPATYRGMKRLKQIAAVFIRHGFYDTVSRINIPGISSTLSKHERKNLGVLDGKALSPAQRARMAFEELGPTFIKLGQMLSLEPDIIPTDFVEEFRKLQDKVPPFPFGEFKEIIESELGKKTREIFKFLDPEPIAAASIAQVHYGNLLSGEKVAVKVLRPNIEEMIREDIGILKRIARTMEKRFKLMELLNPVGIVGEFENFITKEMDFTNEAASMERFASNFKDDPDIYYIPDVFWDFTTPRVLVMERLVGIEMDEVEKMVEAGLDPVKISKTGLTGFAKQILEYGYFHADPHPGNSFALADGRIGLVDFGIMGFIDQEMMRHLANICIGYAEHDYDQVIAVFVDMGILSDKTNLKNFKYDLMDLSEPFYGRTLEHVQVKDVFDKVIGLAAKYRIRLPRELILFFKTMIALEGMGKKLSPNANILEIMKPYAIRLLGRTHDPKLMMGDLRHSLFNYANILRTSPDLLHKVLKNLAAGSLNLNMTHKIYRLEEIEKNYISSSNRLTVGVVAGTSALAGAWILASENQLLPVSIPFLGIENIPLTTILGLSAFVISTVLGAWLAYNILFRSK